MSALQNQHPEDALTAAEVALAGGSAPDFRELPLAPPRLDPDEPRRSGAELSFLARALGHVVTTPERPSSSDTGRVGYRSAEAGDSAVAWPALAEALAGPKHPDLRGAFPDLWQVDAGLWAALPTQPPPTVARTWLTSPGRRLIQDIELLSVLATPNPKAGATDLSWDRLLATAGARESDGLPSSFRALHDARPEVDLRRWTPPDLAAALYTLEQGTPALARGGALCWLLQQATERPVVSLAGVMRDLREELPARLAVALSDQTPSARAARQGAEIEILSMAHAARIAVAYGREQDVPATWQLARWIQSATTASPFYGGDLDALAARLRALLPLEATSSPYRLPALTPARFGSRSTPEVDPTEYAWVAAVAWHYVKEDQTPDPNLSEAVAWERWTDADRNGGLRPVPRPLLHKLQTLAQRPLRPGEKRAEDRLTAVPTDSLLPHVAPPLLARHVLTEQIGAPWLAGAPEETGDELVWWTTNEPSRVRWVATAVLEEGATLAPALRTPLLALWRKTASLAGWTAEERAVFGLGLRSGWRGVDETQAFREIVASPVHVRPTLLKKLADAPTGITAGLWTQALHALIALASDTALEAPVRVDALGYAAQLLAPSSSPDREKLLAETRRLAEQRPFRDAVPLLRELRRLGIGSRP